MRLKLRLLTVEPETYPAPTVCPMPGCGGITFSLRQTCPKKVRDTVVDAVRARRYACLRCHHPFRVYPVGISQQHCSAGLKGVAVLLYVMGISSDGVAQVLQTLNWPIGKTAVYDAVQAAGERVPGVRRGPSSCRPSGPVVRPWGWI